MTTTTTTRTTTRTTSGATPRTPTTRPRPIQAGAAMRAANRAYVQHILQPPDLFQVRPDECVRLCRLMRPAPTPVDLAHPANWERNAQLKSFRYWLRERERTAGRHVLIGVTGDAERCPVAAWLRLERDYARVIVRAGDTTPWSHGRPATFQAYEARGNAVGRKLGIGYCDAGLTAAISWLDGWGASFTRAHGHALTVGECLRALEQMEREWPPVTVEWARPRSGQAGERPR